MWAAGRNVAFVPLLALADVQEDRSLSVVQFSRTLGVDLLDLAPRFLEEFPV